TSAQRAHAIAARLQELLASPLTVEVRQLSSGASRATYAFATAAHGPLVLQVDRGAKPEGAPPPQAALLAAAADAGGPVARVVAHGDSEDVLGGSWTVVEELAGTAAPGAILAGEGAPPPEQLIDQIAAALAAVHRMPADEGLAPATDDPVMALRATHDALGE